MLNKILSHFGYNKTSGELAGYLVQDSLREEFLGVAESRLPSSDEVISTTNRLANYTDSQEYKVFAKEVWARSLSHLDAILEPATTGEKLQYHRGALRASLDLLRLSYQVRSSKALMEKEQEAQTSTPSEA